jgi:hypothetical protein
MKILAREWLYFVASLLLGFLLTPIVFFHALNPPDTKVDVPGSTLYFSRSISDDSVRVAVANSPYMNSPKSRRVIYDYLSTEYDPGTFDFYNHKMDTLAKRLIILNLLVPRIEREPYGFAKFLDHLTRFPFRLQTWLTILIPYFVVQFLRSIRWALITMRDGIGRR